LVFGEIDDDRDAAVGHEAFFGVGRRAIAVIPEALDKTSERRARSEKQPFHEEMVRQSGGSGKRGPSLRVDLALLGMTRVKPIGLVSTPPGRKRGERQCDTLLMPRKMEIPCL
jgi:hypothetical protein